jgi:hypothetical protein
MLTSIAQNVILPALSNFQNEAKALEKSLKKFQLKPTEEHLQNARQQWRKTDFSWRKCELYNLGSFKATYTRNRIDTAPTKEKYIERFINEAKKVDRNFVMSKGSNIVGLPALEYMLFAGKKTREILTGKRLDYLVALSEALAENATQARTLWGENEDTFKVMTTSQGTDLSSGISMLFNEMIALTEKILMTKLGKPLGKQSGEGAKVEMLVAFRSLHSLEEIKANIVSLQDCYNGGDGSGFDDYLQFLKNDEAKKLSDKFTAQFKLIKQSLEKISSLENALLTNTQAVEKLYSEIKALLVLLKVDAANQLALTVTFNDNDGD